jgi:hypothetical protein
MNSGEQGFHFYYGMATHERAKNPPRWRSLFHICPRFGVRCILMEEAVEIIGLRRSRKLDERYQFE